MAWGKNEDDEEALSGKFVLWRGGGGRTVRESERERARDVPKQQKKERNGDRETGCSVCLLASGFLCLLRQAPFLTSSASASAASAAAAVDAAAGGRHRFWLRCCCCSGTIFIFLKSACLLGEKENTIFIPFDSKMPLDWSRWSGREKERERGYN